MKIQRKPLSLAIKVALGMAAVSLPFTGYAEETESNDSLVLEEVVATGSHIKGLDLEGATNAVQLNSKDIMESGADSLVDLLDNLSVTGGGNGTFTTEGSGPGSDQNPVGASAVSLRGLGTSSTLTLVNGRRVSVASFAKGGTESFVDINSIPLAAVERVEVLPSGASAIYGADAVAGVVNVILKDDYEGLQISGSYGNSTASSDNGKTNLNLAWGTSTDNARGMVVVDYFKREALYERDRSATATSLDPSASSNYVSVYADQFSGSISEAIEEAECAAEAASGNRVEPGDSQYGRSCFYNVNDVVTAQGEFESVGVTGTFDYDFGTTTWFNEVMYQTNTAKGNRAGAPWDTFLSIDNPFWDNEQALIDQLGENFNDLNSDYTNQTGLTIEQLAASVETYYGDPAGTIDGVTIFGRFDEPRETEVETSSLRFVSGLEGELDSWDWETAISYGRSESSQTGLPGLYKSNAFEASLAGKLCESGEIAGSGETCADLDSTEIWYNPFDGQANQPDGVLALLQADASREGESNLYSWDAKASTLDLFTMPAGPVAAAFGAEWRREEVKDVPSVESIATDENPEPIIGFSSTGAEYDRDQYAAYGELSVPLAEGFEAQLAGRYDEYSDFGGDFNGKIGLRYQVIDEVTLRANWSESFRAPSLAQAGLTTKLTSHKVYCDDFDLFTQFLADQPKNYCEDGGTSTRTLDSELVGNDQLKAETADTYGFGVLLRPTYDIELNLDWWRIEYDNTIVDNEDAYIVSTLQGNTEGVITTDELATGSPGLQVACDPSDASCTNPEILDIHSQPFNAGKQTVEGVDLVYTHYLMDNVNGQLTLLADASYLIKYEEEILKGFGTEKLAGEFRYPRLAATAKLRYRFQNWSSSISANYTGEYKDDLDTDSADNYYADLGQPVPEERTIPSWTTYDLSVSYDLANDSFVQLNVNNILDEDPNLALGSSANVDYSNTNIMGRFVTVRYNHVF